MKKTVCNKCGKIMFDNDRSIRFKCAYCGQQFPESEWKEEMMEQIKEAVGEEE